MGIQQSESVVKTVFGQNLSLSGYKNEKYFMSHQNDKLVDLDLLSLAKTSIKPGTTVLDVGANIGYFSIVMSQIVGRRGVVHAFEPYKETVKILKHNLSQNKINNVHIYEFGVGSSTHVAHISFPEDHLGGAFVSDSYKIKTGKYSTEEIRIQMLDEIYKEIGIDSCRFMKVDIEGYETEFLKGATNFIQEMKPIAIIEANHWCLNAFNRQSLPDYIEEVKKHFPIVYAFDQENFLDLSNDRQLHKFYQENILHNKFMNLFCGFDKAEQERIISTHLKLDIFNQANSTLPKNDTSPEQTIRVLEAELAGVISQRNSLFVKLEAHNSLRQQIKLIHFAVYRRISQKIESLNQPSHPMKYIDLGEYDTEASRSNLAGRALAYDRKALRESRILNGSFRQFSYVVLKMILKLSSKSLKKLHRLIKFFRNKFRGNSGR